MKRFLLPLVFLAGCCSREVPKVEPVKEPTEVRVLHSPFVALFQQWAERKVDEWTIRFQVDKPKVYMVYAYPRIDAITPEGILYRQGEYYGDSNTIVIYLLDPNFQEMEFQVMKLTLAHEFLHHLDKIGNVQCPQDHNLLFLKRIEELGLLK